MSESSEQPDAPVTERSDPDLEPRGPSGARSALYLLLALAIIATAIGLQVTVRRHFLGDTERSLGTNGPTVADLDSDTDESLYEGPWTFTQGLLSIALSGEFVEPGDAYKEQVNGLLGAADKDALMITPPRKSGVFDLTIQLLGTKPAAPEWCEDEVEVSHLFAAGVELNNLDTSVPLDLPEGVYRVRYCAKGQDAAAAATKDQAKDLPGQYLLQLWPEGASGDAVIKEGSAFARARNDEVTGD